MKHMNKFLIGLLGIMVVGIACNKDGSTETNRQREGSMGSATNNPNTSSTTGNTLNNSGTTGNTAANEEANRSPNNETNANATLTDAQKNETPAMDSAAILSRIRHTNQMEIKMGKLAVERASDNYVKDYGRELQKDHAAVEIKVKDLAKKLNITLKDPIALSDTEAVQMKKHGELLTQLETVRGKDFDKKFLEGAKTGHQETIHMLETVQVSNSDVKSLIGDILPTIRGHYRRSVDIVQDVNL